MKPTVRSCTGPSAMVPPKSRSRPDRLHRCQDLGLLHVELGLREHALVEQRLELRQLGHAVFLAGGGRRWGRLGLLLLQVVDLLVLRGVLVAPSLHPLADGVGASAYDGSAQKEWHALLLGPF